MLICLEKEKICLWPSFYDANHLTKWVHQSVSMSNAFKLHPSYEMCYTIKRVETLMLLYSMYHGTLYIQKIEQNKCTNYRIYMEQCESYTFLICIM
jgi:hypothetical protein